MRTCGSNEISWNGTASVSLKRTISVLPDVAEALRPLLEQTQEHVWDLQPVLGE